MVELRITPTELVKREKRRTFRYPNLRTVLMVEKYLQERRDTPLTMSELRKGLPKRVMHPTLKIILEYLWRSGKIIYGPRGIQWIYAEPEHLQEMLKDALEV